MCHCTHSPPLPPMYSCLPDWFVGGGQISSLDWPEGNRGNNQPTSETIVCKLAVFWSSLCPSLS